MNRGFAVFAGTMENCPSLEAELMRLHALEAMFLMQRALLIL